MPNRVIKDSICESKGLSEVSIFASDLYKRLITYADDYGRFNADYQIVLARLYPREMGYVTVDDIEDAMTELVGVGKIAFYTSQPRDELYGCLPKWKEHQRIRESKQRIPEPSDTTVNDYYYRRFIPLAMKVQIVERDKFTCQDCGKKIWLGTNAKRFVKMGTGLFHIDHIVPVHQGGRATLENLRLTCPACNLKRPRQFTIEEIIEFSSRPDAFSCELPQVAANICELRPESNPIQSNPNPNPNPNISVRASRFVPPTVDEVREYCQERNNNVDPQKFVDYYTSKGWKVGRDKMVDYKAAIRNWERNDFGNEKKQYLTRQYSEADFAAMETNIDDITDNFGM